MSTDNYLYQSQSPYEEGHYHLENTYPKQLQQQRMNPESKIDDVPEQSVSSNMYPEVNSSSSLSSFNSSIEQKISAIGSGLLHIKKMSLEDHVMKAFKGLDIKCSESEIRKGCTYVRDFRDGFSKKTEDKSSFTYFYSVEDTPEGIQNRSEKDGLFKIEIDPSFVKKEAIWFFLKNKNVMENKKIGDDPNLHSNMVELAKRAKVGHIDCEIVHKYSTFPMPIAIKIPGMEKDVQWGNCSCNCVVYPTIEPKTEKTKLRVKSSWKNLSDDDKFLMELSGNSINDVIRPVDPIRLPKLHHFYYGEHVGSELMRLMIENNVRGLKSVLTDKKNVDEHNERIKLHTDRVRDLKSWVEKRKTKCPKAYDLKCCCYPLEYGVGYGKWKKKERKNLLKKKCKMAVGVKHNFKIVFTK